MIGVNLIPSAVLRARQRSRRIRRWIVAAVVAAALSAMPVLAELRQHARHAELLQRKEADTAKLADARANLQTVGTSLRQLRDSIERANMLRTRRCWAGLLTRIVQCMPEEVWLTSLATEVPKDSGASLRRQIGKKQPAAAANAQEIEPRNVVTLAGARSLTLEGFAVDHEQLYEFMTRLKQSDTFPRVELVKAGKEPVLRSQGVRFELTCTW